MIRKIQHLTLALLLAGLALALTLTPTRADNPPAFLLMWGFGVDTGADTFEICTADTLPCHTGIFTGTANGQFAYPTGVAVITDSVYVVDSGNNRIQKFDSSGSFLDKWGSVGSGDGQFASSPVGVAADSSGNVFVIEIGLGLNPRVQKFDSNGTFVDKWGSFGSGDGQFSFPTGVAVDSLGYVYVADTGNHRIQKFTSSGVFSFTWGSNGSGNGQFNQPTGIAVDSADNVYVADSINFRIQKFDSSGTFLDKWGSNGSADDQFGSPPTGVGVDQAGNVYVTEKTLHRIKKFDSGGTFLTKWGTPGDNADEFNGPHDIAVDGADNIYVVEESNHRVQKFEQRLLAVTKTVNNDTPRSGERITYTITVHNGGAISATNTVISDTLPVGLTAAGSATLEGASGTTGPPPTLASNVTITNGSTITVTFPVTVNTGLAPNTVITNTAAVTSTEVITPQTGSTLITVNPVNLTLIKVPSKVEDFFPNPGQRITYTISVKNSGLISATNAVISDTLPDGLTFAGPVGLEGSNGSVAQNAGDLPTLASGLTITNGSTITVTLPVTVNTGQDHGTIIINTAAVTSDEVTTPKFGLGLTIVLSDTISPTFLIDDLLTGSPLITPTLGITLDTLFPIFEWYAAWDNGQILTYLLTLSSTLDIFGAQSTSISFTTAQTSFVSPVALSNGDYTWTVQAQDVAGNVNTPAIPPQSFTIAADNSGTAYLPIILKNE